MKNSVRITSKGNQKIQRTVNSVIETIKNSLKMHVDSFVLNRVSDFAPSHRDEAKILSSGVSDTGEFYSKVDLSRSFIKGGFKYLKDAIKEQKSVIRVVEEEVWAKVYNTKAFNESIGFSWLKKKKGHYVKRSTTDSDAGDVWKRLISLWELGGTFTVTPRDMGDTLVSGFKSMTKTTDSTMGPWRMYDRGVKYSIEKLKLLIEKDLKKAVGKVSKG